MAAFAFIMSLGEDIKMWYEGCEGKADWMIRAVTFPMAEAIMYGFELEGRLKDFGCVHEVLWKEGRYLSNIVRYYRDEDYKSEVQSAADLLRRERDPVYALAAFGEELLDADSIRKEFLLMCERGEIEVPDPNNVPFWQMKKCVRLEERLAEGYERIFGEPAPERK